MNDIQDLLDRHPELGSVTRKKVGQVLQVAILRLKDRQGKAERLVVGNTHLFYHPMADHIRAIQVYTACMKLDKIRRAVGESPSPLILCGDLNSDPLSGALRLLLQRKIEPDHYETWKHLNEYSWEKGQHDFLLEHGFVGNEPGSANDPVYVEESFQDARENDESETDAMILGAPPEIRLPASFPNLLSGYQEMPAFTNFAVDFAETLDYILVSEPTQEEGVGFEVLDAAPLPTSLDMKKYVAMPNECMPSDHVSIVCDLRWKRYEK
jgi:2',5'-phosphodiesterase